MNILATAPGFYKWAGISTLISFIIVGISLLLYPASFNDPSEELEGLFVFVLYTILIALLILFAVPGGFLILAGFLFKNSKIGASWLALWMSMVEFCIHLFSFTCYFEPPLEISLWWDLAAFGSSIVAFVFVSGALLYSSIILVDAFLTKRQIATSVNTGS